MMKPFWKIKKNTKKVMPKMPMAKNPLKVKTHVKAGENWDWLWSWGPWASPTEETQK